MSRHITRRGALAGSAAALFAPAVFAQDRFPARTITFVVPFPAGGTPTCSRGCSRRS